MGALTKAGWLTSLVVALAAGAFGCVEVDEPEGDSSADPITKPGETSPPWLYEGPLPALDSPELVTSIAGHTTRMTGLLPRGYDARELPWYVVSETEGERTRVHVVYPIATGKRVNGKWNNVPGTYDHLNVRPYRPNDPSQLGKEHWGGFPFLNYHDQRRFALHGPIDFVEDGMGQQSSREDWRLVRGRVSMGCQRMQGEHVLELTHMLGFDMSKPWTKQLNAPDPKNRVEGKWIAAKLTVLAEPSYDRVDGKIVDVAYPKHPTVDPLPAGEPVMTFPTWDANDMRAWACAVKPGDDPNRVRAVTRDDPRFDGSYCLRTNGPNLLDSVTGE